MDKEVEKEYGVKTELEVAIYCKRQIMHGIGYHEIANEPVLDLERGEN